MSFVASLLAASLAASAPSAADVASSADVEPLPWKPECSARLCNAEELGPFLDKLDAAGPGKGTVRIMQIGDSHTAGDMITNGLRTRLQRRFGNAGRGVQTAGKPYRGFISWGVTLTQSDGWRADGTFGNAWDEWGKAKGIASYTQTAAQQGASIAMTTDSSDFDFDTITICGLSGPQYGAVVVEAGFSRREIDFKNSSGPALCETVRLERTVSHMRIETLSDDPVSLTSIATENSRGGVTVSNLGVSGSQLKHFERTDDAVIGAELKSYHPDLIILAYGTNEGFGASFSISDYERKLDRQVRRLRRLAGYDVPVLIVGTPDAATRNSKIARQGGVAPAYCVSGWMSPGLLGQVRQAQEIYARDRKMAYWDWHQAMGGDCMAGQWNDLGLVYGDHVHFTKEGGLAIGGMLADDIEGALLARKLR